MRQSGQRLAEQIFKGAFRIALLPFTLSAAALHRSRGLASHNGQSAEYAKFDTRKWTPALLKHLEWRRFEELCTAYFEALGFTTRTTFARLDGGADLALCAAGSGTTSILAHCRAWDAYRVGIRPVRELRAAMAEAHVYEGALITSGRFTDEAVTFARKENIDLIDGAGLLAKLDDLPPETAAALLKLATQGDYLTPTCPNCSIKMTMRQSTQGGRKYWGCFNYPRCKHTSTGAAPA